MPFFTTVTPAGLINEIPFPGPIIDPVADDFGMVWIDPSNDHGYYQPVGGEKVDLGLVHGRYAVWTKGGDVTYVPADNPWVIRHLNGSSEASRDTHNPYAPNESQIVDWGTVKVVQVYTDGDWSVGENISSPDGTTEVFAKFRNDAPLLVWAGYAPLPAHLAVHADGTCTVAIQLAKSGEPVTVHSSQFVSYSTPTITIPSFPACPHTMSLGFAFEPSPVDWSEWCVFDVDDWGAAITRARERNVPLVADWDEEGEVFNFQKFEEFKAQAAGHPVIPALRFYPLPGESTAQSVARWEPYALTAAQHYPEWSIVFCLYTQNGRLPLQQVIDGVRAAYGLALKYHARNMDGFAWKRADGATGHPELLATAQRLIAAVPSARNYPTVGAQQQPEAPKPNFPATQFPKPQSNPDMIHTTNKAFADKDGPFNPLGASLFWAIWGEKNDPERLDANLAHLKEHGVDYVRILGMVGTYSWADRRIDPNDPEYWQTVEKLFQRLKKHGLRAQVTIFADAQVMLPGRPQRDAFVGKWAEFGNAHQSEMMFFEVANEAWQNGFPDSEEVRDLGGLLQRQTTIPVALSAAFEGEIFKMYAGWDNVATMHYDRDTSRADGAWRPIRQPWGWPDEYKDKEHFEGFAPRVCVNNEPIGPQSSVAWDDDPIRIALGYVTTFIAGNAAYCYHAGAGIRGGGFADAARGRLANYYDYDSNLLDALSTARFVLPKGVANWTRHNSQWESFPWKGFSVAVDEGRLVRAYAATNGNEVVLVLLNQKGPITVVARQTYELTKYNIITGEPQWTGTINAGETWVVDSGEAGSLFVSGPPKKRPVVEPAPEPQPEPTPEPTPEPIPEPVEEPQGSSRNRHQWAIALPFVAAAVDGLIRFLRRKKKEQ
jgi:hypothetical protein